jgi:sulfocyanin
MKRYLTIPTLTVLLAACGGGGDAPATDGEPSEPVAQPAAAAGPVAPTGPLTVPEWYTVDNASQTVNIQLTAGSTPDNNYWNFNGFINGEIAITVPEGYTVNVTLTNDDPNMAHSVGVSSELTSFIAPPAPNPVFEGAITENPQSMTDGVMPGESETITFVADAAGNYSLVCYIPGHSAVGMWLFFNVSGDGGAGVQGL